MDRRTRFEFGASESFTTLLSARPWLPSDSTIGGSRIAASGVPAAYEVRRDALLELTLRIKESEWADFLNFIVSAQSGEIFQWFPDAADTGTSVDVYLQSPMPGERWTPSRDATYPRMLEVSITLRGAGGAIPWLPYFA